MASSKKNKSKSATKAKSIQRKKARPPQYFSKRNLLVAALVVVAILAGFFAYRMHVHQVQVDKQFAQDKARFAATEKDMASIYAAITKQLGQPFDSSHGGGCDYTNLKFKRGPLGCAFSYVFSYGIQSRQASKQIGQTTLGKVKAIKDFGEAKVSYDSSSLDKEGGDFSAYFNDARFLNCVLYHATYSKVDYDFNKDHQLKRSANTPFVSQEIFQCEGNVAKALFKIHE